MREIYIDFRNHRHCELFNKLNPAGGNSEHYINENVLEMLYDRVSGQILAKSYYNDFKVLAEHIDKYTKENLKTFKNISELDK